MDFSQIFSNPSIQKYLFDLSAGMSKGMAEQPTNLNVAIGAGLARAGAGRSEALGNEIEAQRQMDLQEQERLKQKAIMQQLLGDRSALTSNKQNQPNGIDFTDPQSMMSAGLALASSGSPELMRLGDRMIQMGGSIQKTTPDVWITTTQNIGGKEIPVQINGKTGEVKPYSSDIINGPKVTWNSDLRQYEDAYGNAVRKPFPGSNQISSTETTSIEQPSVSTGTSSSGQAVDVRPKIANFFNNPNLTPGENAKLAIGSIEAQRGLEVKSAEKQMETQQKNIEEAKNFFSPDNQQTIKSGNEQTKALLDDLEKQIPAAHNYIGSNLKPVQEKLAEWGIGEVSQLDATAKNLVATKLAQMKAAGVMSAGQLNSDRDISLQYDAIFNPLSNKETQLKQLDRLKKDIAEADKLIAAKEKKFAGYLGQEAPKIISPSVTRKVNGKTFVQGSDGNWTEQ